jgi:hypothetical protein
MVALWPTVWPLRCEESRTEDPEQMQTILR